MNFFLAFSYRLSAVGYRQFHIELLVYGLWLMVNNEKNIPIGI
ncbi:MAG TPA: hypothetical protein PKY56_11045 [Candidatus Kapabacteria bacterium]|nr:hypothetical protein [Candidatus Kapabacteria bacterium]HPO63984.1 hypothetical protein [Candidatus Kapabacteria bacterium]